MGTNSSGATPPHPFVVIGTATYYSVFDSSDRMLTNGDLRANHCTSRCGRSDLLFWAGDHQKKVSHFWATLTVYDVVLALIDLTVIIHGVQKLQ